MAKTIVVTGGVMSGLGKGIASASIGRILQSRGYRVSAIKIDPYLNQDAGTMNPIEHGEVFVLDDGGEVDMDFGHYSRFMNISLTSEHNITTGKIYKRVMEKERKGDYLGQTVQVIPHVTNEVKAWIRDVAKKDDIDILIIEVGGTTGDIENLPFLEALRQMKAEEPGSVLFVHLTLVPDLSVVGEQKTKPTQHSVKMLREVGIDPDVIIGRSTIALTQDTKKKISLFCNVKEDSVISSPDCETIYEVPIVFESESFSDTILRRFRLGEKDTDLANWKKLVNRIKNAADKEKIRIAIPGKYTKLHDSYVSILESLKHAGANQNVFIEPVWIDTEEFEKDRSKLKLLKDVDGIVVPGGFGSRGTEGKMLAIQYARENNIPFLGLCYGMQLATIEYARNVCGLEGANSTEIDKNTPYPVIDILPEQKAVAAMGGTMRLGAYPTKLEKGTKARDIYGKEVIYERHRHRYEVNPDYIARLEEKGLIFSGKHPERNLMEVIELKDHPFFLASQFHPEFKSGLEQPAPLFVGLVKAAQERRRAG